MTRFLYNVIDGNVTLYDDTLSSSKVSKKHLTMYGDMTLLDDFEKKANENMQGNWVYLKYHIWSKHYFLGDSITACTVN